jgi:hypothetical protein
MGKRRRTTASNDKLTVSEYALMRRINRLLRAMPLKGHRECQLCKTRERPAERRKRVGKYFIVADDAIVKTHIDLEDFGREHGALAAYEALKVSP